MGKFNNREVKIMSITLAVWGLFLFISGVVMKTTTKPIIETKYSLNIEKRKIAETQAKTNEIKIKDIEKSEYERGFADKILKDIKAKKKKKK